MSLIHTLREGNACADFLAKREAEQMEEFVTTDVPLEGMSLLLFADASGVSFVRP